MRLAVTRGAADLSGIHVPTRYEDSLYISKVIHQANIDVDEKGTEASAATAVIDVSTGGGCVGGPRPAKEITLRLDHPFLFFVRDLETGAILFMGRVVDPSVRYPLPATSRLGGPRDPHQGWGQTVGQPVGKRPGRSGWACARLRATSIRVIARSRHRATSRRPGDRGPWTLQAQDGAQRVSADHRVRARAEP
jgi:hypothetical protein